jgi:hypothetical protein
MTSEADEARFKESLKTLRGAIIISCILAILFDLSILFSEPWSWVSWVALTAIMFWLLIIISVWEVDP